MTSISFFVFVAVTLLGYYICPGRYRYLVLLLASYIFYAVCSWKWMVFIIGTTFTTYAGARGLQSITDNGTAVLRENRGQWSSTEKKDHKHKVLCRKRRVLTGVLLLNFGILAFLKYCNFALASLGTLFGFSVPGLQLILPLGISFYTFQAMGYIIDVYRGTVKAEMNPAKFALFVSFFPQIIQGPIGVYSHLAHQLYEPHIFEYRNLKFGFQLILWGLFKKLVIADRASVAIRQLLEVKYDAGGFWILISVLLYALQLYADFSGGIDMIRGVSEMLGIHMGDNFKRPYFAKTLSDYWRRWHISLGAWCKNYLFYPIAMSSAFTKLGQWSRKRLGRQIGKLLPGSFATVITFLVIGLWHGANWKYVGFGLWNGLVIFTSNLLEPVYRPLLEKWKVNTSCFSFRLLQMLRTFVLVLIGYYFDVADGLGDAFKMMWYTVTAFQLPTKLPNFLGLSVNELVLLLVSGLILFSVSLYQERSGCSVRQSLACQSIWFQWGVMLLGILAIAVFGMYGPGVSASEFVYMQF